MTGCCVVVVVVMVPISCCDTPRKNLSGSLYVGQQNKAGSSGPKRLNLLLETKNGSNCAETQRTK
jgi:hypothetical protein